MPVKAETFILIMLRGYGPNYPGQVIKKLIALLPSETSIEISRIETWRNEGAICPITLALHGPRAELLKCRKILWTNFKPDIYWGVVSLSISEPVDCFQPSSLPSPASRAGGIGRRHSFRLHTSLLLLLVAA